jgi:hypothetical protein
MHEARIEVKDDKVEKQAGLQEMKIKQQEMRKEMGK